MTRGGLTAEIHLSRIGLSARAMNVCAGLDCKTMGELADVFQREGLQGIIRQPNCGRKTLDELVAAIDFFTNRSAESKRHRPETLLSNAGLSVRAVNVCEKLGCTNVGDLVSFVRLHGSTQISETRNCGAGTVAEIEAFVRPLLDPVGTTSEGLSDKDELGLHDPVAAGRFNPPVPACTAEELLEAIAALQIPYGLPLELVKLPVRIQNWCRASGWVSLGEFLQNTGSMILGDFLALQNIGKASANQVLAFFDALRTGAPEDLATYLPLAPNSTAVCIATALNDAATCLDLREARMLELRLVKKRTLDEVARDFSRTRELVRQTESRFLRDLQRILDWFTKERVELWQRWEATNDLAPLLVEKGVTTDPLLVASGIADLFENTPEAGFLEEHWLEGFRLLGCELMASLALSGSGVDLAAFAREQGREDLAARFPTWIEANLAGALSVSNGRAAQTVTELTRDQRNLLYGRESAEARWRSMFEKLKAYHFEHGDADVPSRWEKDPQLASWVSNQRESRKRGMLPEEQVALLDQVGLRWLTRERGTWEERYAEMAEFKNMYGHCDIPITFPENPKLGRLVNTLRTQKSIGTLSAERIAELEHIGFAWKSTRRAAVLVGDEVVSEAWKTRYEELLAYRETHGDCDVPAEFEENQPLANWVSMQRQAKKRDALAEGRVKLLEETGFSWRADSERRAWDAYFAELLAYKEAHGNCDVPVRYATNLRLGSWVVRQRSNQKLGRLSTEHEQLLDDAGFLWQAGTPRKPWEIRYAELLAYRSVHGHCDVSTRDPVHAPLGVWIAALRQQGKMGELSEDQVHLLNEADFVWSAGTVRKTWETRYAELLAFRAVHGHCDVSTKDPVNGSLGAWVVAQRRQGKLAELSDEQVHLLNEANFVWSIDSARKSWNERYADLLAFRAEHGHCEVSTRDPVHASLGMWVAAQRRDYKNGELNAQQEQLLNDAGFAWNADSAAKRWEIRFAELVAFRAEHGHCDVSTRDPVHASLGAWVATQRRHGKNGKLSSEQMQMLDEAGFNWQLRAQTV